MKTRKAVGAVPEAIILGANHHNTYGIIRALSKFKIRPIVIINQSTDHCFYKKSRYIKELINVPFERTLEWLIDVGEKNRNVRHTLYVSSDALSELVDGNSEILRNYYNIPGGEVQGILSRMMDKQVMSETAIKFGLFVPPNSKTYQISELKTITDEIHYPVIIKPIKSSIGQKSDICICHNPQQLDVSLNQIKCHSVQLQDFIEKEYEFQLIGLSLNKGEQVIIPGVTKVLWAAFENSNTGIVQITTIDSSYDQLIEKVTRLIKNIGYSGSFSAEFLRDKHGKDYFMEINFRNDGNAIVVTAGGVNLHQIWWEYNNNSSDYNKYNHIKVTNNAIVTPFWSILPIAHREHKLFKLMGYMFKSKLFMDLTISDPMPLIQSIFSIIKLYLKK